VAVRARPGLAVLPSSTDDDGSHASPSIDAWNQGGRATDLMQV
jgi:hypothetical protein